MTDTVMDCPWNSHAIIGESSSMHISTVYDRRGTPDCLKLVLRSVAASSSPPAVIR